MTSMRSEHRSIFWPLILIGVGIVWLLANAGILQPANLRVLFQWWPLILIVIGAEILFGRSNPRLSLLVGVGGALALLALMLLGPSFGWARGPEVNQFSFSEPVETAERAQINLNLSVADTHIQALSDSAALIDAELSDYGKVTFNVTGSTSKTVTVASQGQQNVTTVWPFDNLAGSQARWDIGLNGRLPLDLNVSGGVGDSTVDLRQINLAGLTVSGGVGSLDLNLPSMENSYNVTLTSGTGDTTIRIADKAALRLNITGGVGSLTVEVPDDAAVRVEASVGVGSINLPDTFNRVGGKGDHFIGDSGVWESAGFSSAARQIVITFSGGVGDFSLR